MVKLLRIFLALLSLVRAWYHWPGCLTSNTVKHDFLVIEYIFRCDMDTKNLAKPKESQDISQNLSVENQAESQSVFTAFVQLAN